MTTNDLDPQQAMQEARLDERDEIVAHLREVAGFMLATAHQFPWYRRWGIRVGAEAIRLAAETIGQRHLKQDV